MYPPQKTLQKLVVQTQKCGTPYIFSQSQVPHSKEFENDCAVIALIQTFKSSYIEKKVSGIQTHICLNRWITNFHK